MSRLFEALGPHVLRGTSKSLGSSQTLCRRAFASRAPIEGWLNSARSPTSSFQSHVSRSPILNGTLPDSFSLPLQTPFHSSSMALSCISTTPSPSAQLHVGKRGYSTTTRKFNQAQISESAYHDLADETLDSLTDSLEALVEEYDGPGADEYEAEYASGVLNVRLGSHGTYVINKQPPNKQIWFSSPRSGPKRFDYDAEHNAWFMFKDGEESNLRDLLDTELSDIFGKQVRVRLEEYEE